MPTDGSERPEATPADGTAAGGAVDASGAVAHDDAQQDAGRSGIPVDLVSGVFLIAVVAVFVLNAGDSTLDWIFPLTLSYTLGILAVALTIRGLLGRGDRVDTLLPVLHGRGVDVLVFTVIAAIYVILVPLVGFWTMSAVMIFVGSVYLDPTRSRRRIAISAIVALAVCLGAYVLLVLVLFVPLPPEAWLPG
jgi:Tripartite tricarboxylate transporter TctB family